MSSEYTFSFHATRRDRFRDGSLIRDWRNRYPQLFDDDDERVLATDHQRQYHFFEWLAAVLLHESTGYLSLVEKYTAASHPQKRQKLKGILPAPFLDWLTSHESGQPDLFVYCPQSLEWFFCEVKGPGDRIRQSQKAWHADLLQALSDLGIPSENRVRILSLRAVQ